jgi:hypothetical protein
MSDERATMEAALIRVDGSTLQDVQPLPYRRVLQEDESTEIRSRIRDRWRVDVNSYWYPLTSERPADVEAFEAPWLLHEVPTAVLQGILLRRGVSRIWEVREGGPDYAIDRALFEPEYNGQEGYWTSEALDWIVYASHESSLTVGGWLLDEVRSVWPGSVDHIYKGWEFEWPPT